VSNGAKRTELAILGMRSNACRERVGEALSQVEGVKEVSVSLIRANAIVVYSAPCGPAELRAAVRNAGYRAAPADRDDPQP
jgi:copper chaperone CopZ